jgi:hypothetical protein
MAGRAPSPEGVGEHAHAERFKPLVEVHARRRIDSITVQGGAQDGRFAQRGALASLRAVFNDARQSGKVVLNPF